MLGKIKLTGLIIVVLNLVACGGGALQKVEYRKLESKNMETGSNKELREFEVTKRINKRYKLQKNEYAKFDYPALYVMAFNERSKQFADNPSANTVRSLRGHLADTTISTATMDMVGHGVSGLSGLAFGIGIISFLNEGSGQLIIEQRYKEISDHGITFVKLMSEADVRAANDTMESEFALLDDTALRMGFYAGCESEWINDRVTPDYHLRGYNKCTGIGPGLERPGYFGVFPSVYIRSERILDATEHPFTKTEFKNGIQSRIEVRSTSADPIKIYQDFKHKIPDDWYAVFSAPGDNGKRVVYVVKAGVTMTFNLPPNPFGGKVAN